MLKKTFEDNGRELCERINSEMHFGEFWMERNLIMLLLVVWGMYYQSEAEGLIGGVADEVDFQGNEGRGGLFVCLFGVVFC